MNKLEVNLGDASFTVFVSSKSQNHVNTPINLPHFHIDKEIHVVLSGTATMEIDGKKATTEVGDVYVIPQNVSHYYHDHSEDFHKISFLFTLSKTRSTKKGFSEYSHYNEILGAIDSCLTLHNDDLVRIGGEILSLEYSERSEHIYQALYALFFITLARLVESNPAAEEKDEGKSKRKHKESYDQKNVIEAFFLRRYGENVTIEDLARALYKSVPQTHRIVKNYFDSSFKAVLIKQRMEQACLLIRQSDRNLAEIALACGYTSYNGFFSAFKKYTGKTPEEYRNTQG